MTSASLASRAGQVLTEVRASGRYTCFDYAGVSAAYYEDEGSASEWMKRFFAGYFTVSDSSTVAATVYSTGDAGLFASLRELSGHESELDKDEYVDISVDDALAVIHTKATKTTPHEDVYYLLFPQTRKIVLVTSGNVEVRREEGMQTLRALMKWLLIENGWIPMHSACVASDDRVICITGGKASGKTSTLLTLLARNRCDLVAIDKFLIRTHGPDLQICGIPGKAGIRVGSALVLPPILDWLAAETTPFFPHMSAADVRHITDTTAVEHLRTRKEKIHLLPMELTGVFGTSITPVAPLRLVLIPVFDLGIEESRLTRCDPQVGVRALSDSYAGLLTKGEGFLQHLFDLNDGALQQRLAALLSEHLSAVPVYELRQNHKTNEQSAKLVAGLLVDGG